ncbi:MAG TPA: acyltransferase [Sphingomonadaceae bacterium]|nr:acyltransferase [Sphingomonadaceae bacterium]
MPQRHIVSHTGLRGIAALLVVCYHLQHGIGFRFAFERATPFFERGYLWVDLFFILSGFIISYTSAADRATGFTARESRRFIGARIARVYPLHIFVLAYLVLFAIALQIGEAVLGRPLAADPWQPESVKTLLLSIPLLHAWDFGQKAGWNIPSWSISAEMFAYLLFPLLVAAHVHARRLTRAALLAGAIAFYLWVGQSAGGLDIIVGLAPLRCLAGFALGMLIFYAREPLGRLPDGPLAVLQLGAAAAIIAGLALPWPDLALIPPFALLVATTWRDKGPLVPLLTLRPVRFLGEISYSVYMNHVGLIAILAFFWTSAEAHVAAPAALLRILWIALVLGTTLLFSTATYRYIEQPARRWLAQRLAGRAPRVPDAVPVAP